MTILEIQKTLNKKGFGPLVEDGIDGPNTQEAVRDFQRSEGLVIDGIAGPNTQAVLSYDGTAPTPSGPKTGLDRIIMHWSAGGHRVSILDKKHYHYIVDGEGNVHNGKYSPEDNISTASRYAAHTYMANTGSIGVSMAAMVGAREAPFNAGSQPITDAQIASFTKMIAGLCKEYGIPLTRETVLSHAEVQPTLGIKQRGKWDIAWIPGMESPGNPVEVGDSIRAMIEQYM